MKHLFLFIFLCVQFVSFAQVEGALSPNSDSLSEVDYVYLYTKRIIKGDYVSYENKVFKRNYILVDDERFELNQVKFYQNESGFFANVQGIGMQSGFAEKVQSGEVNLFELEVKTSTPMMNSNGMMTGGMMNTSIIDYYNKGFGNLKRATYGNLKVDLSDKPEAKLHLDKYNRIRMTQNGFYIAGGALLVGSVVAFFNQPDPQNFDVTNTLLMAGAASATGFTAYLIGLEKKSKLKSAITAYNRF